MDVVVTGIGLRSALGDLSQTWQAMLLDQTGIRQGRPFGELPEKPLALIGDRPLADVRKLTQWVLQDALLDAGLTLPLRNCGVVVGSSRGNQTRFEQFLQAPANLAQDWLQALPYAAAQEVAHMIQTQSITLSPMAACATGIAAIAQGAMLIDSGRCDRVIAGAIETPVTRLTMAGFEQMGAMAQTGGFPFDVRREGLALGEGGAIVVLEAGELARSRQAQCYGRILGFGSSADADHISSPARDGHGAIAAIRQSLQMADLAAASIQYIHAHGTGTKLNDAMEAQVIQQLFGSTKVNQPWVSSSKGAVGHTLGAASAIGVALTLMSLSQQQLLPSIGCAQSDFDLNVVQTTVSRSLKYALCQGFGFGGQNGAIVLGVG
jgi:3-oxoacyl-[acyl-carrier-protein] synthase II